MANDKPTILVCDDNDDILDVVSMIVRRAGYNVVSSNGYKELLAHIATVPAKLLVCDIRMPDRDGFWIAEHLQMHEIRIPIIFMTAYDSNLYRTYAPFVGSVGFVTKLINSQELLAQIEKALLNSGISPVAAAMAAPGGATAAASLQTQTNSQARGS